MRGAWPGLSMSCCDAPYRYRYLNRPIRDLWHKASCVPKKIVAIPTTCCTDNIFEMTGRWGKNTHFWYRYRYRYRCSHMARAVRVIKPVHNQMIQVRSEAQSHNFPEANPASSPLYQEATPRKPNSHPRAKRPLCCTQARGYARNIQGLKQWWMLQHHRQAPCRVHTTNASHPTLRDNEARARIVSRSNRFRV